jgi:hypothetical protein
MTEKYFPGADAVSRESGVGLKANPYVGRSSPGAGFANYFIAFPKSDSRSGRAGQ